MLCWGAGGASEPIPCSQLVENLSLEPTWRTAAVCWSRMCCAACLEQVLPEPGGNLVGSAGWSRHWDRGMSRAVFASSISVLCEGTVQLQRVTSQDT